MSGDAGEAEKAARERLREVLEDLQHLGLVEVKGDTFVLTGKGFMELARGSGHFINYVDRKGELEAFLRLAEEDEEEAMVCMVTITFKALLALYKYERGIPGFNVFDADYVLMLMSLSKALVNRVSLLRMGLREAIKVAEEVAKRRRGG